MNINVHIERLILDGISIAHRDRPLLQAAVEAELARLLAIDGVAPEVLDGGALARMQGGSIQIGSDGDPGQLGRQIAKSLHIDNGGNQ